MIKVYDQQMQLVAFLENAFTVGYEMPFNSLWRASFSLPAKDEKNAECIAFRYVEIYDDGERIELFRILPNKATRSTDGATITYECEHVLATLIDDVLFQYHTVGNLGYYTNQVIDYVLSKQIVQRWQTSTIDFARQFEYNWENDNLLGALLSIPKPFVEEYMWTWDTTVYPWQLNLVAPSEDVEAYIRYGVNMQGITKYEDPTNLCTRLYCLGYGEGVNQLGIAEVNNGLPYIDSGTQDKYGIISKVWVDRRYQYADTLLARGQAILDELKIPRVMYEVEAVEEYNITKDPLDRFKTGTRVRVIDDDGLGIDVIFRVANKVKGDIYGDPGAVRLEIANRTQDISTSLANLQDRQRINETYAQGATNVNIYDLAENCDPTHPAKFRIWVPEEAVRINKVLLTYENEPFRANSKAIESSETKVTTSGASSVSTTTQTETENSTRYGTTLFQSNFEVPAMSTSGSHNHGIPDGTMILTENGSVMFHTSGSHQHLLGNHYHNFTGDPHRHGMDHTHLITIPAHTHEIKFGIYEGPTATTVGLLVDGNNVGGVGTNETDIDLVDYLELGEEGKIKRGQFHEIEIIPNTLSRVVATVVIQFFVQSRGGGDY